MGVTITSDEAIVWLRSHHMSVLEDALSAINLGEEMLRRSSELAAAGGWHRLKEENPAVHAEMHREWLELCRKHRNLKEKLSDLSGIAP